MSLRSDIGATADVTVPTKVYFTSHIHHEAYDRISPSRPALSANGKNVVVTGGGTGIGKAIATGFAQAGAQSVSILGRREGRLIAAVADIRAAAINAASVVGYEVADLLKREEVDRAFQSILAQTGNIEILVCNAAVLPAVGPLSGYDADQFMNNFSINVLSTFNTLQAFLPLAPPNATIINITAAAAHIVPMPGASAYAVGKAASLKMVDYFAAENPNLHIVSMQPGTVATDMSAQIGVKAPDSGESFPTRWPV